MKYSNFSLGSGRFNLRFHHQRLAVRLLIGHCVALSRPLPMGHMIGIFCLDTPIEDIVIEALTLAEELCLVTYDCVPPVELSCTATSGNHKLLSIPRYSTPNQTVIFSILFLNS